MTWQDAIALSIVAAACIYLARQVVGVVRRKRASACGGCAKCPSEGAAKEPAVVSLQIPAADSTTERD